MQQLGYTDSIFINLETVNTPQHIGFMGIYDPSTATGGVVRFKDVLANFESRLNDLPKFRTRLVQVPGRLDKPYWVLDDSFDVEYHIRHLRLPHPGDWRQLCIQAARLHSRQMDLQRPLWECNVIEGLDNLEGCPPGSFAVYVKIHHSMVDGDLGQRVLGVLHDREPYPASSGVRSRAIEANLASEFSEPRLGGAEMVGRAFSNRAKNTVPWVKGAAEVASDLGETLIKVARKELPPLPAGPKTRWDEPVGPHRVFESATFSVAEMKKIGKIVGATVNDVCVSSCSGAMRKYLQSKGELPEESLLGNLPVNMRLRGTISDENNVVASMMASIHTEVADPIERLNMVHDSINQAKQFIGTPISNPFKLGGIFPPFISKPLARLYSGVELTRFLPAGTPAVVTNVRGPQDDLYANGARLIRMHLLGMLTPGVGLFHAVFSLADVLTISILADRDQLPDPTFYRECLEESYAELREGVLG